MSRASASTDPRYALRGQAERNVGLEVWRFSTRASEAGGERAEPTSVGEHARRRDREAIGEKRQTSRGRPTSGYTNHRSSGAPPLPAEWVRPHRPTPARGRSVAPLSE